MRKSYLLVAQHARLDAHLASQALQVGQEAPTNHAEFWASAVAPGAAGVAEVGLPLTLEAGLSTRLLTNVHLLW